MMKAIRGKSMMGDYADIAMNLIHWSFYQTRGERRIKGFAKCLLALGGTS